MNSDNFQFQANNKHKYTVEKEITFWRARLVLFGEIWIKILFYRIFFPICSVKLPVQNSNSTKKTKLTLQNIKKKLTVYLSYISHEITYSFSWCTKKILFVIVFMMENKKMGINFSEFNVFNGFSFLRFFMFSIYIK